MEMCENSGSEMCFNDLRSILELSGMSRINKRAVVDFCIEKGLIGSRYECPVCKKNMKLVEYKESVDGFRWRCNGSLKGEKHWIARSIRLGSWFEQSKLSIIDILIITYAWVEKYTHEQIMNLGRVAKQTVTDWMSFCREVCKYACVFESSNLGGEGKEVEIDESLFGKNKYGRGKPVKGKWVFGGVERGSHQCFFEVVHDRTKETLLEVIKRRILPGTTIISDCWRSYACLKDEGYKQMTVNHKVNFKNPVTGAHTNTIEGLWSHIKRQLRGKRVIKDTFDPYLAEFMWRKQHRNSNTELNESFLRAIIVLYPPRTQDGERDEGNYVTPEPEKSDYDSDDGDNNRPGPSWKKTKYED